MIKRAVVTGDLLRPGMNLSFNIHVLSDLVGYQLAKALDVPVITLVPPDDFVTTKEEWVRSFDSSADCPHWYLDRILSTDFVVGFEMPIGMIRQLSTLGIPFVDVRVDSIRYMDDVIYGVRSFGCNAVQGISEDALYIHAGLMRARLRPFLDRTLAPNTGVIIGQSTDDYSLIRDTGFVKLSMYEERIRQVVREHSHLYFLPHPYDPQIEYQQTLEAMGVVVADNAGKNAYYWLAHPNVSCVYGICSGVLYEAKYFGKRAEFFSDNSMFLGHTPVTIQRFLSFGMWKEILAGLHTCQEIPEIWLPDKPNRIRQIHHAWWGYDNIEAIK